MGKFQMLAVSIGFLALAPSAQSNTFPDLVAEFCDWCTSTAAAQQKAWSLAPLVHCDWPGGVAILPIPPDIDCWSPNRQVLLINPHTESIFAYNLVFDSTSHSHRIEEWSLSPDLSAAASTITDIYQALVAFDFSYIVQGNEVTSFTPQGLNSGEDCPQGTALDHYLNPGMREWMINQMRQNWLQVLGAFLQREPQVSRSVGISASVGPISLTVGWDSAGGAPIDEVFRAGFIFGDSEVSTSPPFDDMLVFDVHEFFQTGMNVAMDIEFNEGLSQVAGQPVNTLFSGQAVIDNPCVLRKLDEYVQSRPDLEFREGGAGGPLFEFPPASNPFEGQCSRLLCARVCVDGVCGSCQFTVTVLVACL